MTERGILFSAPMVRAILAGTKTQTRRAVRPQPPSNGPRLEYGELCDWRSYRVRCPYGKTGDRLWVRETWSVGHGYDGHKPREIPELPFIKRHYAATEERGGLLWRPSIFMPRWMSRITLEITEIRVWRLQDISGDDCVAEGIDPSTTPGIGSDASLRTAYAALWGSINGAGSWKLNPWVWAISFRRA